jgi:hypothetical protein
VDPMPVRHESGALSPRGWLPALTLALAVAAPAGADVLVKQSTTSQGLGGFGDGTSSSSQWIAGDRSRSEDEFTYTGRFKTLVGKKPRQSVTILRLDKDVSWTLEPEKKQYRELTFAEMREAMEKGMADAEAAQVQAGDTAPKDQGMKWTLDVKRTGARESIAGFPAEQVVVTCIGKPEKPEKGQENAELRLLLDQWLSTKVPGQAEMAEFYKRFAEDLGLDATLSRVSPIARRMYGNGMRELASKLKELDGYALRSSFSIAGPPTAEPSPAQTAAADEKAAATQEQPRNEAAGMGSDVAAGGSVAGAIGGLFGRKLAKKASDKTSESAEAKSKAKSPDKLADGVLFRMTTEVTSISAAPASAGSFEVPEGYKLVKR